MIYIGEVMDTIEKKYTAKQAMQSIVECLNDGTNKAIQIITMQGIADSERKLFVKMIFHWIHKNKGRVLLIANGNESLKRMKERIETSYKGIKVIETATWEEHGVSDDKILNRINGSEVEFIIASLSREVEEAFTKQNRMSLNAKVWIGLGTRENWKRDKNFLGKITKLIANARVKK